MKLRDLLPQLQPSPWGDEADCFCCRYCETTASMGSPRLHFQLVFSDTSHTSMNVGYAVVKQQLYRWLHNASEDCQASPLPESWLDADFELYKPDDLWNKCQLEFQRYKEQHDTRRRKDAAQRAS